MAGIGLGVAVNGVVAAGAAGLLPQPVERVVGGVVETLTPLTLPERVTGKDTTPEPDGRRRGGTVPGAPGTTGGPSATDETVTGPGVPGSSPQTGPGPTGSAVPPADGATSTTRGPSPGVTGPGITSPSVPPVVPTSTTLPAPLPFPSPTLPNVSTTVPVTVPTVPAPLTTLPGLPW